MLRAVLGVVVGGLVWIPAFFTLARLLLVVWPGYAGHAEAWMSERVYTFTPAMSAANAVVWIVAEIFAGWLAVVVAARRQAAWVLAALIGAFMALNHLFLEWDAFPWWYNLAVTLPAVPAVLLGGRLGQTFRLPTRRGHAAVSAD